MVSINKEKAFKNAEYLKEKTDSTVVFFDSLSILKFEKTNWKRKLLFLGIEACVAAIIATQLETISLTKEITTILITILIALTAIVFTGYAFFQALVNDTLLVTLMSVDIEKEGNLYKTNKYFAKVMIFQLVCVVVDLILVLFAIILPSQWSLFYDEVANECIAAIGILLVLHINFEGIWEMKSFIFNVFQLFNLHAYSRLVQLNKAEKEK